MASEMWGLGKEVWGFSPSSKGTRRDPLPCARRKKRVVSGIVDRCLSITRKLAPDKEASSINNDSIEKTRNPVLLGIVEPLNQTGSEVKATLPLLS